MPLFTEDELLTIGQHMREQPDFPATLSELYSDDVIRQSFSKYSGIIRYVLPHSQVYHSRIKVEKEEAFKDIDWRKCFSNPNIESPDISHFVVKYEVTPPHFHEVTYDLVSEDVEFFARAFINELTANDRIRILKFLGIGVNIFYTKRLLWFTKTSSQTC
jgi:hypothetical protein